MSTTTNDIEQAICEYLKQQWTNTPIQWPNQVIDPDAELASMDRNVWVQVHVLHNDPSQETLSGSNTLANVTGQRYRGFLHINFFIKHGLGTREIKEAMDDLRDLINHKSLTVNSKILQFYVPKPQVIGIDGDWWRETLITEWDYLA